MNVPFLDFGPMHGSIKPEVMEAFESFYDSKWYVLGDRLVKFEEEYAAFSGVNYAIGTSNGLDAIYLGLKSLGIGDSDEVIMPSNTFIATVLAVTSLGAIPVFVEPDRNTYLIDPKKIKDAISAKTKAIIPIHLYGQACQMDEVMELAKQHQLYVLEDNAQAHGATFKGQLTGSFGDINATSFYPGKNLGALGDAGALTTQVESFASSCRMLRNYGSSEKYRHTVKGHNMRMDELQAAILSVKLKHLYEWTANRKEIAEFYSKALFECGDLILPKTHPEATHVYHLYVVRSSRRDELQDFLKVNGIGTLIHYPIPAHLQKAYQNLGFKKGDFPIAEELADTCLSLPIWPGITQDQLEFVSQQIKSFFTES